MAAIKVKDDSEFRSLLDGLAQHIVDAHVYWKIWKTINELFEASPEVYTETPDVLALHAIRASADCLGELGARVRPREKRLAPP